MAETALNTVMVGARSTVHSVGGVGVYAGTASVALSRSRDLIHGGPGQVPVVTELDGTPTDLPVSRLVRLHRQVDGLALRQAWSDNSGVLVFPDLNTSYEYYAVSFDHTRDKRAVIADRLVPEVPA